MLAQRLTRLVPLLFATLALGSCDRDSGGGDPPPVVMQVRSPAKEAAVQAARAALADALGKAAGTSVKDTLGGLPFEASTHLELGDDPDACQITITEVRGEKVDGGKKRSVLTRIYRTFDVTALDLAALKSGADDEGKPRVALSGAGLATRCEGLVNDQPVSCQVAEKGRLQMRLGDAASADAVATALKNLVSLCKAGG